MKYNKEFWLALDELVNSCEIIIDRPKGTRHPKYPNILYYVQKKGRKVYGLLLLFYSRLI
ncbi:hypothetical protein [Dethiothermospora halolimnae]|uniref:hypothetical protein n=1 Tax=Dethiothermospora halolimnae TaxID=3114390 RepID=UPI003CCC34C0